MTADIHWPTVVKTCRQKANSANRQRRGPGEDGEWHYISPLPKLNAEAVLRVMLDAFGRCHWCQAQVWLEGTLEHLKRIADGGTNEFSNLTWACARCNRKGYYREG